MWWPRARSRTPTASLRSTSLPARYVPGFFNVTEGIRLVKCALLAPHDSCRTLITHQTVRVYESLPSCRSPCLHALRPYNTVFSTRPMPAGTHSHLPSNTIVHTAARRATRGGLAPLPVLQPAQPRWPGLGAQPRLPLRYPAARHPADGEMGMSIQSVAVCGSQCISNQTPCQARKRRKNHGPGEKAHHARESGGA